MTPRSMIASPRDTATCTRASAHPGKECEFSATPGRTTLGRLGVALALAAALVGCGGGGGGKKRGNTYVAATSVQEQCCEHLVAAAREDCLRGIVRVSDEAVASSAQNQDTYACVQEHFACDPATGRATQPSAQAQLDCIQDLP